MTMTTAPNVDTVGSVSPGSGSRLQIPVMSGSLQIRAPSAGSSLDEPRSPHDLGASDKSEDEEMELSPSGRDVRHGLSSGADSASDGQATSPTPDAAVKRGAWSPQEDEQLIHLVETMRPLKWVHVSAYMKTRTSKQCRERYHNYLKPTLNRAPISKEEGRKIEELVAVHGKRWAEISRQLPGRSDNAIKNWWNASVTRRRASQDTSAMMLQSNQQQKQPPQPQSQSQSQPQAQAQPLAQPLVQQQSQQQSQSQSQQQQHLPVPAQPQTQLHYSDDSDHSPRASASPPAPPPVSIMFNKTYMDPACRSPVTQSRGGPQRTRSVAHVATLPYPPTTSRWADSRPRLSVGSISSIGSRSNSVAEDNGRSVSPNASPPGLPSNPRSGLPDDIQMPGFWNRRVPDYRRPSDALRSDVTSLSQYSLSTASNPNSRRSSLNPVVPAELARPHGQPPLEKTAHHVQQPPLQQVLQAPLAQLQPASNAIQVQNAFSQNSPNSHTPPRSAGSQESQQQAPPAATGDQAQQTQASSESVRDHNHQNERSQPQNNRSSLARLSIANLTNPMPE